MKKFSSKQMISLALALFGLSAMIWLGATRFYAADAKNVVGNLSYTGDLLPNSPRSMQFIHSETLDPKIPTGNPLDSNNGDTALYQWISGQSTLYLL